MSKYVIYGKPVAQGSKRHVGRGIMVESAKALKPWRQLVSETLLYEHGRYEGDPHAPIRLRLLFVLTRPRSAPKRRTHPTVKPDLDKLTRAIFDAGSGILWNDDAQVVEVHPFKVYGSPERVEIEVM